MGADCVLLIAAALAPRRAERAASCWPSTSGSDVLVEIHDEAELRGCARGRRRPDRGEPARPGDVRRSTTSAPCGWPALIPDGVVKVAESGVRGRADAASLHAAGYHAVLVGETLVTAADPRRRPFANSAASASVRPGTLGSACS